MDNSSSRALKAHKNTPTNHIGGQCSLYFFCAAQPTPLSYWTRVAHANISRVIFPSSALLPKREQLVQASLTKPTNKNEVSLAFSLCLILCSLRKKILRPRSAKTLGFVSILRRSVSQFVVVLLFRIFRLNFLTFSLFLSADPFLLSFSAFSSYLLFVFSNSIFVYLRISNIYLLLSIWIPSYSNYSLFFYYYVKRVCFICCKFTQCACQRLSRNAICSYKCG